MCDRLEPWAHGTAVRATAMPAYWDFNAVRVEGPDPGLDAPALIAAADELQGGLAHRRIEVEDEAAGARVRAGFEAAGWAVERLAWMRRDEGASAGASADGAATEEVSFAATRPLREAWHLGTGWAGDAEAVEAFLALEDAAAERLRSRAFAVRDGGRLVAFATLWAPERADAAEIQQLFVAPGRRGDGLGAALVRAAAAGSGRGRTWIVADDEGRPKRLYARLGFATAWIQHGFVRRPEPQARRRPPA